jgi:hypothetical protein
MKITIEGHEIQDARITKISLVKHGAIRAPFKIVKAEHVSPSYAPPDQRKGAVGDHSGNQTVIVHRRPDNGETATGRRVDDAYPLGRPDDVMRVRKDHSFDAIFADARRRKRGNGW